MKFDKNDINSQLGLIAVGLILMNLGFFARMHIRDVSITFINGLFNGIETGLMIIGVFVFIYGFVNVIRLARKK